MERSRIRAVQMDSLRSFPGIRRRDRAPNVEVEERTDEIVLRWFGHIEGMGLLQGCMWEGVWVVV